MKKTWKFFLVNFLSTLGHLGNFPNLFSDINVFFSATFLIWVLQILEIGTIFPSLISHSNFTFKKISLEIRRNFKKSPILSDVVFFPYLMICGSSDSDESGSRNLKISFFCLDLQFFTPTFLNFSWADWSETLDLDSQDVESDCISGNLSYLHPGQHQEDFFWITCKQ